MRIRKMLLSLTLGLGVLPLAHADLTIHNNTNHDSTSIQNNGSCSTILPQGKGVTKAHQTNSVPNWIVKIACGFHPHDCKSEIYMTNNCTGPVVAMVMFDLDQGIKSIENKDVDGYVVSGSGLDVTLSGGPA